MIKEYSIEDEHTGRDVEVLTHTIDELERVKKENERLKQSEIEGQEIIAELEYKNDELTAKCRRLEDKLRRLARGNLTAEEYHKYVNEMLKEESNG